jgi:hypothetical protein
MISIVHAVACNTVHFIDGNILFNYLHGSVADPHHIETDSDPACHFDADADLALDPDPACHVDADQYPTFYFDTDPDADPDPSFEIRIKTLTKG